MRAALIILAIFIGMQANAQTANETIRKGNEHYRKGEFEQAQKQYSEAVKNQPANTTAKYNLSAATYRMGKEGEAMKTFDEVAKDGKEAGLRSRSYYNKGAILSKQKRLEESIEAYKNALRSDPADKEARENLQKALLELKKKEPPKKEEENKKKKQQQQQQKKQQQPRLNQKEAEQRLKLLEQKEKEVQQRLQKEKAKGGSQTKDW